MKFELNVKVAIGGIQGTVIGRAEYARAEASYLVDYVDGHGNPVSNWFDEQRLTPVCA